MRRFDSSWTTVLLSLLCRHGQNEWTAEFHFKRKLVFMQSFKDFSTTRLTQFAPDLISHSHPLQVLDWCYVASYNKRNYRRCGRKKHWLSMTEVSWQQSAHKAHWRRRPRRTHARPPDMGVVIILLKLKVERELKG